MNLKKIYTVLILLISVVSFSQRNIQVNGFGHMEFETNVDSLNTNGFFSLGEHDLFVSGNITNKVMMLPNNLNGVRFFIFDFIII